MQTTTSLSPSKKPKVMAILHLCIAFTVLTSVWGYPFLGELFEFKTKSLLYHAVMGDATLIGTDPSSTMMYQRLERNKLRFSQLSETDQNLIKSQYLQLQQHVETPFMTKIRRACHIVIFELPAFEQMWLLLSIVIGILLLLGIEGAAETTWLLPLLVLCYGINNQWHGETPSFSLDTRLFPSEEVIIQDYLREPLSKDILTQREQLLQGWKRYLIKEWAHEIPANDVDLFESQAESGEFFFNVARLKLLAKEPAKTTSFNQRESLLALLSYLAWNLFFAWQVSHRKERRVVMSDE